MEKNLSSLRPSSSRTTGGGSKSPTGVVTSSSAGVPANPARRSRAAAAKSTGSSKTTRKGTSAGKNALSPESYLEVLTSTLSLGPKAGMTVEAANYQSDKVQINISHSSGLRLCNPGSHKAHFVLLGDWNEDSGTCQKHVIPSQ